MEKLQENTPKKHKFKNEPCGDKHEGEMATIKTDKENKENATIKKAKKQNSTIITDSSKTENNQTSNNSSFKRMTARSHKIMHSR
jgi:hypothetical protein